MKKNKIAESIIIKVGGGIREIRREPEEIPDVIETTETDSDLEKHEDMHSFRSGPTTSSTMSKDEIINCS